MSPEAFVFFRRPALQVGVPLSRIFTINPKGQLQKASTAVQSSTWSSLSAVNELCDEVFPPIVSPGMVSANLSARESHAGACERADQRVSERASASRALHVC